MPSINDGAAAALLAAVLACAVPLALASAGRGPDLFGRSAQRTQADEALAAKTALRLADPPVAARPVDKVFTALPRTPLDRRGLTLVFHDEFERLSLYDPATRRGTWKTSFIFGDQAGPNAKDSRTLSASDNSVMIYVDKAFPGLGRRPLGIEPFSVKDGVLTITARRIAPKDRAALWNYQFASGLITTEKSFRQTYGYFEIRARLPRAHGAWPAFWVLPTDASWPPEADILEQIGGNTVYFSKHSIAGGIETHNTTSLEMDDARRFHTYGLLWTASTLTWYVDDAAIASASTPADMNKPMYLLANLAIGGNWPGYPSPGLQATAFHIDYIRAYRLDPSRIGAPNPSPPRH